MRRILLVLSGAVLGTTLLVSPSLARNEPAKAGKYQSTLVTAYKPCTAPNDTTNGALPLPACHPAVPDDLVCSFNGGSGKAAAKVDPAGDVALKIQLKGVDGSCDGDVLRGVAGIRVTTNQCTSADPNGCTVSNALESNFPVTNTGSCTLDGGKCKIKTSINTELGAGTVSNGHQTNISILGVGLQRSTGTGSPAILANAGVLLP